MQRIDFLVPGFSKCGTTTLCALLDQHPGIYIPALKEPWYFSADDFDQRADDYRQHFVPAAPGQLLGEGSVSYSGYRKEAISVERIQRNNPDCRFLFIARNPVRRIESSYREMHHSGVKFGLNAPFSLAECLHVFPQMLRDSCYISRIQHYLEVFGEASVQVLFLEELREDPQAVLSRCFAHLGLPDHRIDGRVALNSGADKLRDSRPLRYLRTRAWSGIPLSRLNPERQDRLLRPLGLRRSFRRPILWDGDAWEQFETMVKPEAEAFLRHCGKPGDYWDMSPPTASSAR